MHAVHGQSMRTATQLHCGLVQTASLSAGRPGRARAGRCSYSAGGLHTFCIWSSFARIRCAPSVCQRRSTGAASTPGRCCPAARAAGQSMQARVPEGLPLRAARTAGRRRCPARRARRPARARRPTGARGAAAAPCGAPAAGAGAPRGQGRRGAGARTRLAPSCEARGATRLSMAAVLLVAGGVTCCAPLVGHPSTWGPCHARTTALQRTGRALGEHQARMAAPPHPNAPGRAARAAPERRKYSASLAAPCATTSAPGGSRRGAITPATRVRSSALQPLADGPAQVGAGAGPCPACPCHLGDACSA